MRCGGRGRCCWLRRSRMGCRLRPDIPHHPAPCRSAGRRLTGSVLRGGSLLSSPGHLNPIPLLSKRKRISGKEGRWCVVTDQERHVVRDRRRNNCGYIIIDWPDTDRATRPNAFLVEAGLGLHRVRCRSTQQLFKASARLSGPLRTRGPLGLTDSLMADRQAISRYLTSYLRARVDDWTPKHLHSK